MGRLRIFIILALLSLAAVYSVTRVRFTANIYELLPSDLPEVRGMDLLNRHFSRDGQLIVTLEAGDAFEAEEASASLAEFLAGREDLISEVFHELPIDALATEGAGLIAWLWLNGDPEAFDQLTERLQEGRSAETINESLEAIEEGFFDQETIIRSYDPLGFTRISGGLSSMAGSGSSADPTASEDGAFRVLYVEGADGLELSDYRDAAIWLEDVRQAVTEWNANRPPDAPAVTTGLTGPPAFMAEIGSAMESDMSGSVLTTTLLIALLFWLMHRRLQPLLWLVAMMLVILCLTLNLGGALYGDLSIMSAGFAAILLGLAVDYGVVLYREAGGCPGDARKLRRTVGPGIIWAAATTAAVFVSLNLSSLPGISELGTLVAIGVLIGSAVMLWGFSPMAVSRPPRLLTAEPATPGHDRLAVRLATGVAVAVPLLAAGSLFQRGVPQLEREFQPFRLRSSPAMEAWIHLEERLQGRQNAAPLIVIGNSSADLRANLERATERLDQMAASGLIQRFSLPEKLVPNPANQRVNASKIGPLIPEGERLLSEIEAAGFSDSGAKLTRAIFADWRRVGDRLGSDFSENGIRPSGKLAEWTAGRLTSEQEGQFAALGSVTPPPYAGREWIDETSGENTAVASLTSLGASLNQRIRVDLVRVFLPMMGILAVMLGVVFREWRDLLLSLFCLAFAAAALVIVTIWTPLGWNSFNVCGIPLLFGVGLDYSIHMIFALRRTGGHLVQTRESIGKALMFCGGSTAIGFGSLGFASARGLASLGQLCAAGILINMIVAIWLLPRWWRWLHRHRIDSGIR